MRNFIMLVCVAICVASVGCCGPLGCGPGCGVPIACDGGCGGPACGVGISQPCGCGLGAACNGGCGVRRVCGGPGIVPAGVSRIRARQPVQQLKRTLACGAGCGESYLGEWISTPPDSCDPCVGDQFVGGATPCRPFCWQRGAILRTLYGGRFLYGGRYANSYRAAASCGGGCGGGCGCGGGEIISDGYVTDSYIEAPHYSSGAECTTCEASEPAARTRIAKSKPQPKPHSHSKQIIQAGEAERIYR